MTIPGTAAGPAALLAVLFVLRLRRNARNRRAIPDASACWRRGWFCHRCGEVFFSPGVLVAMATLRGLVWRAGGYAGLSRDTGPLLEQVSQRWSGP
ncbi:hypothetical protein SD37_19705 [Amycolatopsis orientalis]|uniref:Uncharacterized protein n=1 Tax=Amycolatopsis orientalis TaxID=31958 RepID=A0A193BZR5_AMYOR|nr:hypothetical protein [Amycolatopsis orientalis]ANN17653.1 hypothetical protein SD37_19705 [Amycolatopsis orientalis]